MTLFLVIGKGGDTAPDAANRDVARAQQLARCLDDLVVLEADDTWWTPVRGRHAQTSERPEPTDPDSDARRSSLALVLRETAERESGAVVLLLNADLELVKRIKPVAERFGLPLLWWHEDPPSEAVVAGARGSVAALLTSWTDHAPVPGWLWSVGAGLDLRDVQPFERSPVRPPLRLLTWAPPGGSDLRDVLQTLALARGLNTDAHLTIALADAVAPTGQRHRIEAQIRNLALTHSVDIKVVDGPGQLPKLLGNAHVLIDTERQGGAGTLEALLAMAYGRPVLSSREQFAPLLDDAPLPLRFAPGDERQLADRIKSLAAAWGEDLDKAGQRLRSAVEQEHSVVHWAETVDSIVRYVRRGSRAADTPVAWTADAVSVAVVGNGAVAPVAPTPTPPPPPEQPEPARPEPERPERTLPGGRADEGSSDASSEGVTAGTSRWRRRRNR